MLLIALLLTGTVINPGQTVDGTTLVSCIEKLSNVEDMVEGKQRYQWLRRVFLR